MKEPSISPKPSKTHILWTSDEKNGIKRFDGDHLRKWCRHYGFDFETYSRVDHERAEESRTQYQCVFSTGSGSGDTFEVDGEEWTIQTGESPRTFVEIDEEGIVRIQGWSTERLIDVAELWHEDAELYIVATGDGDNLHLDTDDLTR